MTVPTLDSTLHAVVTLTTLAIATATAITPAATPLPAIIAAALAALLEIASRATHVAVALFAASGPAQPLIGPGTRFHPFDLFADAILLLMAHLGDDPWQRIEWAGNGETGCDETGHACDSGQECHDCRANALGPRQGACRSPLDPAH